MPGRFKLTTWNIQHFHRLLIEEPSELRERRLQAIADQIREMSPDLLCITEGPSGGLLQYFCHDYLDEQWMPVFNMSYPSNGQRGSQLIQFLVKAVSPPHDVAMHSVRGWEEAVGTTWPVHHWGVAEPVKKHYHYRQPQVCTVTLDEGFSVDLIGLHLKSSYVNQGQRLWEGSPTDRHRYIVEALTARVKMASEATNVRKYIDHVLRDEPNRAIFVLGDLNDGPGQGYFEEQFLFFDLLNNLQGSALDPNGRLHHALALADPEHRWTIKHKDFVQPERDPKLLLDHIMYTPGAWTNVSPWTVSSFSGYVEHVIHNDINRKLKGANTSDHRPVSLSLMRSRDVVSE